MNDWMKRCSTTLVITFGFLPYPTPQLIYFFLYFIPQWQHNLLRCLDCKWALWIYLFFYYYYCNQMSKEISWKTFFVICSITSSYESPSNKVILKNKFKLCMDLRHSAIYASTLYNWGYKLAASEFHTANLFGFLGPPEQIFPEAGNLCLVSGHILHF